MTLIRRVARCSVVGMLVAALAGLPGVGSARPPARQETAHIVGPTIVHATCPRARGLGVATDPWPALIAARGFLRAERRPDPSGLLLWPFADRWLRYRVAPDGPAQIRYAFPTIRRGSDRWHFRARRPRWLDARFRRIGPFLNLRLKLLAAGVQVYSCPRSVIRRLIRATWWIQVLQPDCACDPDRFLDVLVVERGGRYRVFGVS